ncbi:MAG: AbrB/MazE/SpoVT family DNA-binding domain-containing protein, partial [Bacteroidota bacterium]
MINEMIVEISKGKQITIPAEFRKELHLKEGSRVELERKGNNYFILGYTQSTISNYDWDMYLIKTDSNFVSWTNWIEGNIFHDADENCLKDSLETGQKNYPVEVTGGQEIITYALTDTLGNFRVRVDTGTYVVRAQLPSNYWEFCEDSLLVELPELFDTIQLEMPVQAVVDCPLLSVDLATPFLRRCFPSTYYVHFCNSGTLATDSASLQLILDPFLTYVSSSIPLAAQSGDTLLFNLGAIPVGECGNFTVTVEVSCDAELGQTHCTEAHIFPDSLCIPTAGWSGAEIEVSALCANDTLHFSIANTGTAPTSEPLEFIVIEDDVILMSGDFGILQPGASESYSLAAGGATYRLEAEQEPNFPGGWSAPSVTVEGCGGAGGSVSFGFVNQFPQDDGSPFVDIHCRQNVGSYDPNDKQAFPQGYHAQHFIEANTELEYLIRFQNTGTDTAFQVVVLDTLSPFLDPATVRPGASSHAYQFELLGSGILKFTFNDILLPDSNVNEPASHGFVQFRLAQRPDVPPGSVIENSAAIYFDFNPPVLTNTTWHTVGQDFVLVETAEPAGGGAVRVAVFPNPFRSAATLELQGGEISG